jgi:hypothetical protein
VWQSRSRDKRHQFGGVGAATRCGSGSGFDGFGSLPDTWIDCEKRNKLYEYHNFSIHIYNNHNHINP